MAGVVCFCSAAASPPPVDVSSAFPPHGMLHSFPPLGISHLFFPSCSTASPQGLLPVGDLGAVGWGIRSHLHPRHSYDFLAVISLNCPPDWYPDTGSQPTGAQLTRAAVVGGGLTLARRAWDLLSPPVCLPALSTHRFNSCLCVSLPLFFILSFFPFPLLRYVKCSQ